jgi:hypothetical protein
MSYTIGQMRIIDFGSNVRDALEGYPSMVRVINGHGLGYS